MRATGGLLRQHDYGLFWLGESVNRICTAVVGIVLPLFTVQTLDAGPITVGLLLAATWLPWLLIGLPAGAWVDRWPPRPVLVFTSLISAVALTSLVLTIEAGVATLPQMLVTAFLVGGAGVFASTASVVFWPSLVTPADLLEGNAKLQASESAALVLGPSLGGLAAQVAGPSAGLALGAAGFAASTACLLGVRGQGRPRPTAQERPGLGREIVEGIGLVVRDSLLRILTVNAALANLAMSATEALVVVFLVRTVGVSPGLVGLLVAGWGAGGLIGALIARRVAARIGTARTLVATTSFAAPFGFLIPLTFPGPGLTLFVVGAVVPFAGVTTYNTIAGTFRQDYCTPETLGRVTATMKVALFGTIPLGALLGGLAGAWLGLREALWITIAVGMLPAVLLLLSPVRSLRDLPGRGTGSLVPHGEDVVHDRARYGSDEPGAV